jgi:hypothetical protein
MSLAPQRQESWRRTRDRLPQDFRRARPILQGRDSAAGAWVIYENPSAAILRFDANFLQHLNPPSVATVVLSTIFVGLTRIEARRDQRPAVPRLLKAKCTDASLPAVTIAPCARALGGGHSLENASIEKIRINFENLQTYTLKLFHGNFIPPPKLIFFHFKSIPYEPPGGPNFRETIGLLSDNAPAWTPIHHFWYLDGIY